MLILKRIDLTEESKQSVDVFAFIFLSLSVSSRFRKCRRPDSPSFLFPREYTAQSVVAVELRRTLKKKIKHFILSISQTQISFHTSVL